MCFSFYVWQIHWKYSSSQRKQFILFVVLSDWESEGREWEGMRVKKRPTSVNNDQRSVPPTATFYKMRYILRFLNTNQFRHSPHHPQTSTGWQFQSNFVADKQIKIIRQANETNRNKSTIFFSFFLFVPVVANDLGRREMSAEALFLKLWQDSQHHQYRWHLQPRLWSNVDKRNHHRSQSDGCICIIVIYERKRQSGRDIWAFEARFGRNTVFSNFENEIAIAANCMVGQVWPKGDDHSRTVH